MEKEPRILIISNNVLNNNDNNGKTISSIVHDFSMERISQLYFSEILPLKNFSINSYFQITDKQIVDNVLGKCSKVGKEVFINNDIEVNHLDIQKNYFIECKRLIREILWHNRWKSLQLDTWLDKQAPDIVFFVAGDCLFTYAICQYVVSRFHSKLITYVTDDYILKRMSFSIIWWIRRSLVFKCMKTCLQNSDKFLSISNEMKCIYKKIFDKDSDVISFIPDCPISFQNSKNDNNEYLVYAGGVYYGRYALLIKIGKAIKKFNCIFGTNYRLDIYCRLGNKKIIHKFNKKNNACNYCGQASFDQLKNIYNNSSGLVFVESFKYKYRVKTRLSFSTKVTEYLSMGKAILLVGPESVSSVKYLKPVSIYANSEKKIYDCIFKILETKVNRKKYSILAINKYMKDFSHITPEYCKKLITDVLKNQN